MTALVIIGALVIFVSGYVCGFIQRGFTNERPVVPDYGTATQLPDNKDNIPQKGGHISDSTVLMMLNELHAHLPEDQRPLSMSDLSDDQAERARNAVRAVLAGQRRAA